MIGYTIGRLGCIVVGQLYPMYRTFKACKRTQEDIDDEKLDELHRILFFWAVNGLMAFAEWWFDFFMSWVPMYYEAKVLLLFWLVSSNFAGSQFIYDNFVEEALSTNEVHIDESLELSKAAFKKGTSRAFSFLGTSIVNIVAQALHKSQEAMVERVAKGKEAVVEE
mmetsp:Transcript_19977/g.47580  ORF Transcript_19977/g.47580 Transcript_19977/m.47580 type:complete len:166 (+) Transcript_19977:187-684(+)|eukprot:CAMPEP_0177713120 /NCGR_PEP_ID=MMETSP0484_2-20121128/12766_1 /TAXON_ID=354590 /ORGANISM="Rhodomonas lens, Strain RHODO" /LENGTH=165 /DNA_ID=CAMNT_0019224981 /DNA_START=181 /DNA_END=678 /DNA_ORIENTATION=-